ncbi:MAG: spermidine synthase [Proteobacteria bacterium]|nr:spermidine synthase [Pseudomonadota bacterium]
MSINLEELDYQQTPIGELILRRRRFPILGELDVYEVILNDEFLMSSLYTAGEIALSKLGLSYSDASSLDVIVGGLGLGYTAVAALEDSRVKSLTIVDALPTVISWHERGLLPVSHRMNDDDRSRYFSANFFELARDNFSALSPQQPGRRYHAVLLDIDHSPNHLLHPTNKSFYATEGLIRLRDCLHPKGVFALWSNDPIDPPFTIRLSEVFADTSAEVVAVDNPITGETGYNTIYLART